MENNSATCMSQPRAAGSTLLKSRPKPGGVLQRKSEAATYMSRTASLRGLPIRSVAL